MGKKSVMESPLLPSPEERAVDALEVSLPAGQSSLRELFQEFLRVALKAQVDTDESRLKNQVKTEKFTFSQFYFLIFFYFLSFFSQITFDVSTFCFRKRSF